MAKTPWYSWNLSSEELHEQVAQYNSLPLKKSARGQVVVFFVCVLLFSIIVTGFLDVGFINLSGALIGAIIYLPFLVFTYLGHRWAIVCLLIYSSIDKIYTQYLSILNGYNLSILALILLIAGIIFCMRALKVENARRQLPVDNVAEPQ